MTPPPIGRAKAVGRLVRTARASRGWSVEQAAAQARLGHMTWRRIEDGARVRPGSYAAVDEVFGLPSGSFMAAADGGSTTSLADKLGVARDDDPPLQNPTPVSAGLGVRGVTVPMLIEAAINAAVSDWLDLHAAAILERALTTAVTPLDTGRPLPTPGSRYPVAQMGNNANWQALAEAVKHRRNELRLRQSDLEARGGPSAGTVRNIERASRESYSPRTFAQLEHALSWPMGLTGHLLTKESA